MNFARLILIINFFYGPIVLASAPAVITISDPTYRQLNLAIPEIEGDIETQKYRTILYDLTSYTGIFSVIRQEAYKGLTDPSTSLPLSSKAPLFKPWKDVGVETLLRLKVLIEKTGEMKIQAKAVDIVRMESILYSEYKVISSKDFDEACKVILDVLQKYYTGSEGIFKSRIVFVGKKTEKDDKQVYISDITGQNIQQLTKAKTIHLSPSWSPLGDKILYTAYKKGNPDLYAINLKTFTTEPLSNHEGLNSGGVFDPTGKFIVYTGSGKHTANLYALEPETKNRYPLTFTSALHVDPDISPDGTSITYVTGDYGRPNIMRADLIQVKTELGLRLTLVKEKQLTFSGWYNTMPRWAPNSKEIAYASYDKVNFDLYVIDNEGKNTRRLTLNQGNNEAPTWSQDGRKIIFHSDREDAKEKTKQLYIMNRDGSDPKKINLNMYHAETPRWKL